MMYPASAGAAARADGKRGAGSVAPMAVRLLPEA
jgi:hypothetical protein